MKKEIPKRKEGATTITVTKDTLANLRILKAYTGIDIKDAIDIFAKKELDIRGIAHVSAPLDV